MKKRIAGALLCALALGLLGGCGAENGETATVESVASITGVGYIGAADHYAGKVVSGETAEVKKDGDKTVLEVLVEEGDMVGEGDVLFTYDTEAMQLALDKLKIEKESLENTISSAQSEISELQKQKQKASSDQQLGYTLQIDARQADIREAEYNKAIKEREIAAMEADMEKTEVTAPIAGRVMSVASADSGQNGPAVMDMYGGDQNNSDAFITIMDVSAYRVQGYINELSRGALTEGTPVTVRSRLDSEMTWSGVLTSIDWEKPAQNNRQGYMGGDEMTSSSKYPFYVTLDEPEGLILGEHVYLEPESASDEPEGLMLPSYYISDPDGNAWVWAASAKDKLEKRSVTLGAYDPSMDGYEILSGLDYNDWIAFPMEELSEGMPVSRYDPNAGVEESYSDAAFAMPGGVVYYEYAIG